MELSTSRPRVLGWLRSAAILDGDWGTSIAYVLGIAFFLGGYNSGLHLIMMVVFTMVVALNYVTICRLYPSGGGVYSAVSHRSRNLAVIGALLLSADYVVTVSLSVLESCHYLGLAHPDIWAIGIILCIGVVNWFGPRHAGSLAIIISSFTLSCLITLVAFSLPAATSDISIAPAPGGPVENWRMFVGIILSISGIEAISNMTGVMKDPIKSSRRAILSVFTKISIATLVLGFAMLALPELSRTEHKEEMIRYLGEVYVGHWFGPIIGVAFGFLLISAGSTAINALVSIQFLMAGDGELPRPLQRLNKYGVPIIPLIVATLVPSVVLVFVHDVITLAHLYAIGVVGAIFINIASTGSDRSLSIPLWTRIFMMCSATVLLLVEVTIAVEKHDALIFALGIMAVGLTARQLSKRKVIMPVPVPIPVAIPAGLAPRAAVPTFTTRMMVAVRGGGERLLRQACEDAKLRNAFLFVLSVKQVAVSGLLPDRVSAESFEKSDWMIKTCEEYGIAYKVISILSPEVGYTIAEQAATFAVDRLVLGATQRNLVETALRGDVIRIVSELLPEEIQLIIYRS